MEKDIIKKENNKKHRFVVGFVGDGNVIYDVRSIARLNHIKPLTFLQAKRALKELHPTTRQKIAIYELQIIDYF